MSLICSGLAMPLPLASGVLDPEPGLVVWTVVTFAFVLLVLWKFAWKPLLSALENREKTIRDAVENAQKLKDDAQRIMEDYQRQLHKAHEEARAIVDEGRRDAEELKKAINDKARTDSQELLERANREIALARDSAIDSIRREAVTLSVDMASKLIKQKLNAKDHQDLVKGALQEMEAKR
ncbi:MAG: F0F1 ATP synthase subunit B [Planctomycetes bacterium]|nr:F0F1 ATP synthase subunit B [Planctomycetota bacterium]MBI3844742.1 F0F1 ATP synthase subunit B [Planctomycetota bacterium]